MFVSFPVYLYILEDGGWRQPEAQGLFCGPRRCLAGNVHAGEVQHALRRCASWWPARPTRPSLPPPRPHLRTRARDAQPRSCQPCSGTRWRARPRASPGARPRLRRRAGSRPLPPTAPARGEARRSIAPRATMPTVSCRLNGALRFFPLPAASRATRRRRSATSTLSASRLPTPPAPRACRQTRVGAGDARPDDPWRRRFCWRREALSRQRISSRAALFLPRRPLRGLWTYGRKAKIARQGRGDARVSLRGLVGLYPGCVQSLERAG